MASDPPPSEPSFLPGSLDTSVPPPSFMEHFKIHTERGAALSVVALLDDQLGKAIEAELRDDKDLKEYMFNEV
jgi:hypothetical protein